MQKLFTGLSLAFVLLGMPIGKAIGMPIMNESGDFTQSRNDSEPLMTWKVMDPTGLNCRMTPKFQGFTFADMNAPDEMFENNRHNFGSWNVLVNFPYGQRLDSSGLSNSPVPILMTDRSGKVWVAVKSDKGMCFVRGNKRHIMPTYGGYE
jgi:hypothetical protein